MRDTINMARDAGVYKDCDWRYEMKAEGDSLKAFEALVRADERAQAVSLYEHEDVQAPVGNSAWGEAYQDGWIAGTQAYRDTIRARGNT